MGGNLILLDIKFYTLETLTKQRVWGCQVSFLSIQPNECFKHFEKYHSLFLMMKFEYGGHCLDTIFECSQVVLDMGRAYARVCTILFEEWRLFIRWRSIWEEGGVWLYNDFVLFHNSEYLSYNLHLPITFYIFCKTLTVFYIFLHFFIYLFFNLLLIFSLQKYVYIFSMNY